MKRKKLPPSETYGTKSKKEKIFSFIYVLVATGSKIFFFEIFVDKI